MQNSYHTNVVAGEVLTPDDNFTGVVISCYLDPFHDVPSMNFFHSKHCFGVYKEPSLLPFTTSFSTGEIFGCAVNIASVHNFLESLKPLGRKINKEGRCESDTPDFHGCTLTLNDKGIDLLETLHTELEEFVQSAEWIDQDIIVVDYLEHWTKEKIAEILTPPMCEEDALKVLTDAHAAAQNWNYRIIGTAEEVLERFEEQWF